MRVPVGSTGSVSDRRLAARNSRLSIMAAVRVALRPVKMQPPVDTFALIETVNVLLPIDRPASPI